MSAKRQQKQAKRRQRQRKREARARARGQAEQRALDALPPDDDDPFGDGPFGDDPFGALTDEAEAIEEARPRLQEDPDDADAWLTLARATPASAAEHLALLQQAFGAADRSLRATEGEDVFERLGGRFWAARETRPYVLARLELAHQLLLSGAVEPACEHLQALVALCPDDDVLARPWLAAAAIEADRLDLAERVCADYAEDFLSWLPWTQALLAFARGGAEDPQARAHLQAACRKNPHVVDYLTGRKPTPRVEPAAMAVGSPEEAVTYVLAARRAWASRAGALAWLHAERQVTGARVPRAALPTRLRGRLLALRHTSDVWRVAYRQLELFVEEEGCRPWVAVVQEAASGMVLAFDVFTHRPQPLDVWSLCTRAMQDSPPGVPGPAPGRPAAVELDLEALTLLAGACRDLRVEARLRGEAPDLEACLAALARRAPDGGVVPQLFPAWTRRPGVTEGHVRGVCAAASAYFTATPWHRIWGTALVLSPADEAARALLGAARPCAVVMGADAETFGLALYDDLAGARRAASWNGLHDLPPATTLTFDPPEHLNTEDLERLRALGCPLAGADAAPLVFRLEGGDDQPVACTPAQLTQLEAALLLVPALLDQPVSERASVQVSPTSGGPLRLEVERLPLLEDDPPDPYARDPQAARRQEEITHLVEGFFAARPFPGATRACQAAAAVLCGLPDSPAASGQPRSWAAGIAYACLRNQGALGRTILAAEVAEAFGVSKATASQKARQVDEVMDAMARILGAD